MPRARLSAYKSSITNRGPQSGGSVGGNDKAGLSQPLAVFSGVTQKCGISRRLPGDCCLKLEFLSGQPSLVRALLVVLLLVLLDRCSGILLQVPVPFLNTVNTNKILEDLYKEN